MIIPKGLVEFTKAEKETARVDLKTGNTFVFTDDAVHVFSPPEISSWANINNAR